MSRRPTGNCRTTWWRNCARGSAITTSTSGTRSGFRVHLPPHRVAHGLRPRVQPQLFEDVPHVELHAARLDEALVSPAGLEPATHSLEGCCSVQLSYGDGWDEN